MSGRGGDLIAHADDLQGLGKTLAHTFDEVGKQRPAQAVLGPSHPGFIHPAQLHLAVLDGVDNLGMSRGRKLPPWGP